MSKKLGTLVKNARTEKGLTQAELAKKVKELTASDISKIERGEKEPTQDVLKKLAKALGVTQASLLGAASGKAKTAGTSGKASGKTSGKTTGKTASKTKTAAGELKLTEAEKKLVQLYRKANADTKKTAVSLLEGTASVKDLMAAVVREKTGGMLSGQVTSGLEDLLGSLLGGLGKQ